VVSSLTETRIRKTGFTILLSFDDGLPGGSLLVRHEESNLLHEFCTVSSENKNFNIIIIIKR
jgi:hypothetical protein